MCPISKVLFFSLLVFLFSFLPLSTGQPESEFDLKEPRARAGAEFIFAQGGDPAVDETHHFQRSGSDPSLYPNIERFGYPPHSWLGLDDTYRPELKTDTPLSYQEQKVMKSIVDDFLVNDDTIGGCIHSGPAIARDEAGNFVITWTDERNGYSDIYAQRYNSSGISLGSNFKVNDDAGPSYQNYPDIAMDTSGNFVITWQDQRSGNWDIYAQRYNFAGTPLGSNFKVNNIPGVFEPESPPAIAMGASGNFVITWSGVDYTNIYAQRYGSSGTPLGSNFQVSDDVGWRHKYSPSIAIDGYGNFIITWEDFRNGNLDIYTQRYEFSGASIGSNFKVNDDTITATQKHPVVAMDGFGNFVIAWEDRRNWNCDIYAQRYDSSGITLGSNFQVNDGAGTSDQKVPAIAIDSYSKFIITWYDNRNGNYDIYAQRYDSFGISLGSNFKVNDDLGTTAHLSPAVTVDSYGNFVITWVDYRGINSDIYAQKFNSSGTSIDSNFKANDDPGSTWQRSPAIAIDDSANFIISWEDYRDGNSDIYTQKCNSLGAHLGSNIKANDDVGTDYQGNPSVAMNNSGNFVITWEDYRDGSYNVYAQAYNSSSIPLGTNFRVNEHIGSAHWYSEPAIAMDSYGNFVITWVDRSSNDGQEIFAQRYNSAGTPLGTNFKVNDDTGWAWQTFPAITMNDSGNFIITWEDWRNGSDIYAQRYNSSGTPLDSNFKVGYGYSPSIAVDGSTNFVITWQYYYCDVKWHFEIDDIYARRYSAAGIPSGSIFKVNDDFGTLGQYFPVVAMDDSGNFVITWYDYHNGNWDIYAQRYDSSGNPVGSNYMVNNSQYASFLQLYPAVTANSSYICFTWQDNRRSKGWDIYAKVVDWNWSGTGVEEEQEANLPNSFELSQNYPNPFNPTTTIQFRVKSLEFRKPIHTTLAIYNILGQKVITLVDEDKLPGEYKVVWDGKDDSSEEIASGIYFYQLKTKDFTKTKKMLLLR